MKKILLALTATFAVCLAVFAGKNMCVKKQNGDILRINVDDVYEVYFEDIFNPDTSTITPPLIEPSVEDTSAYAPLKFWITSNSTVELTHGYYNDLDSVNIPARVKIDGKVYSVTEIGDRVFSWCDSLKSIIIPESINEIKDSTFWDCRALTNIIMPGIKVIKYGAFYGCSSLTNIELNNVDSICVGAFGDCRSLKSINVNVNNPNFSSVDGILYNKEKTKIIAVPQGIKGSISIPSSVTSIGEGAFGGCSSLASIEIPSSVTEIGSQAFWGCRSLASIEIPSSVTEIGSYAFYQCENLDIVIDNSKENVKFFYYWGEETTMEDSYAFYGVKSVKWLKEIDEDPSVADVSAYAPLRFEITSDSTAELTRGENWDSYRDLVSVNIPSKVKIDGKVYSVTSIGWGAFDGCSSLTSIEIPSSVTEIGSGAFADCSSLASIEIPSSVTEIGERAFISCYKLIPELLIYNNGTKCFGWIGDSLKCVEVVIPEGVKSIDRNAFFGCKNLAKVFIPSSVTEIGSEAFYNCSSLTSIEIPSSVTEIGSNAFEYCENLDVVIDNSKENVKFFYHWGEEATMEESYAFNGVKSVKWLKEIDEDPSVADVSAFAPLRFSTTSDSTVELTRGENWDSYRELVSVNIPSKVKIDGKVYSVTSIGWWAFDGCSSLTSIEIPSSVTSIGSKAFDGCSSLTSSIKIPSGVTSIGSSAFAFCSHLTSIEIPSSVTEISDSVFYECKHLIEINIPESVTSIGSSAFAGCSSLTSIDIPSGVTEIGDFAFGYCSSLTSIEIPSSVTEIGWFTFRDCSNLTSIDIPSTVTKIGDSAFDGCSSLSSIEIPSSVTEIGSGAFESCHSLNIEIDNSKENVIYNENAFEGVKSVTWLK